MKKYIPILTILIGILLVVYTPSPFTTTMKDTFYLENNVSFEMLGNSHLIYNGVGHKQLTLMGGTYDITSNLNLSHLYCYGANVTFTTAVKPHFIFSVGCNITFKKPSSLRVAGIFIGSHISGKLSGNNFLIVSNPIVYYGLMPFRVPYTTFIGILLLISGIFSLAKPLPKPSRYLHLTGAMWGTPVFFGVMALVYIIASFFFVAPGIRELNFDVAMIGIYIHIISAYIFTLVVLFGMYFLLSQKNLLSYYVLLMGIVALASYPIAMIMLLVMIPIGVLTLLLIPDIVHEKYMIDTYYTDTAYKDLEKANS